MTTSELARRLGLDEEQAAVLTQGERGDPPGLNLALEAIVRRSIAAALDLDEGLRQRGLGGVQDWVAPAQAAQHPAEEEPTKWDHGLEISEAERDRFERIASAMQLTPRATLRVMLTGVAGTLVRLWMPRRSEEEMLEWVSYAAVRGLPLTIMPTEMMWPADKPFPWTSRAALAAVLGYEVQWPGDMDDFTERLRGKWEMTMGRAYLWQS